MRVRTSGPRTEHGQAVRAKMAGSDRSPWRLVTVDIDGTLTRTHGWREIAVAFGRLPAFEETNEGYRLQRISEDRHVSNLLALASGHTVAEVEDVLERTPKLHGIAEGISDLHRRGARAALLTHNPGYVVRWYERTFGFDDGEGLHTETVGVDGRIGAPGAVRTDKVAGLRALLARRGVPASATAHVGDGRSDAEVFRYVGGGVALNSPLAEVDRAADLVVVSEDFREVVERLARLRPRPTAPLPPP